MKSFILKNKSKIILIAVLALAVFLITFHFTDTPKVWVDEGVFTEAARNFAFHGVMGLQTKPGNIYPLSVLLSTGYPVIFPVADSFRLFGTGIWQARLPMIIFMFALAILFYLFVRKKYGFYPAILSTLLLISFSPFYGNGRPVQGEVPGLVFLVLGLLCLLYWEESFFRNKKWALLSGLAFGLCSATKPIYLAVLSIVLIVSVVLWWKKIGDKKILRFFTLGFLAPIIFWLFTLFPTLNSLLNIIPTYLHLAGNHGSSTPIIQTASVNFLRFFRESTPILFSFLSAGVLISFFYRFFKKENSFSISEYVILFFIILNWLSYLIGTGWYRYFFPANVLLYLLFPAAILFLSSKVDKNFFKKAILLIPLVLLVFQFYDLIFLSDTSFVINRTRNNELSVALSEIGPTQKVLFYNTVEAIIFLKGDNYSQYLAMGDFLEVGDKNALASSTFDYILTSDDPNGNIGLSCYTTRPLNEYYLLEIKPDCKI